MNKINQAVDKYNEVSPNDKVKLIRQKQIDVSNLFVCTYNDGCVGLFERKNWIILGFLLDTKYLGEVYVGFDSDYVGIKTTVEKGYFVNKWMRPGVEVRSYSDEKYYVSNCYMNYSIRFDDVRKVMYSEGVIGRYEFGKATNDEIIDVLTYVHQHFETLNKPKTHIKEVK